MMFKFDRSSKLEHCRSGRFSDVTQRTITFLAVLGASVAVMGAQTNAPALSQTGTVAKQPSALAQPSLNLQTPANDALFSSSADENTDAPNLEASVVPTTPGFAKMMQYGRGQAYNRARYRNSYTNNDGSNKWVFYGGAGLAQPVGDTGRILTPNFDIQVGVGPQFSKHFALPVEFDYDYFNLTRQTINNQSTIYYNRTHTGLDGNNHIWSFSIDPTYTFYSGDSWGGYVVGGVGYFHKVTNFTLPGINYGCGFYFCGDYEANVNIDHYTSNAPGYDAGFGVTYKLSQYSNAQFYAEARYVIMDSAQRYGVTINNYGTAPANSTNFFPQNSNRTTYIPITFGFRF